MVSLNQPVVVRIGTALELVLLALMMMKMIRLTMVQWSKGDRAG